MTAIAPLPRTVLTKARELYAAGQIAPVDDIPCSCGAPRTEHAGKSHAGRCAATGCTRYREDRLAGIVARAHAAREDGLDETLRAYDAMTRGKSRRKRAGQVSVRPSDLRSCRKQIEYREAPPEDYVPVETDQHAAWMGGIIHEEVARRRALVYPWRLYEAEVNVPGSDRPYRYDEYDPITGVLYEIKTAGSWRWDKTEDQGPDEKWIDQAMLYAYLLIQLGYTVTEIVLLVINRENGKSEPYPIPYDEARALATLAWIAKVATEIELGVPQPRDEPGPSTSKMCAQLCPARRHCWNMDEAEALGRSPENLTILGLSPDEEVIEEHIGSLVAARDARLAAKKEEDALRALLDGVELREYGDYKPTTKRTTSTSYSKYREVVEATWNDPNRPIEPPQPETSTGESTTWGRIPIKEREKRAKARAKELADAQKALEAPAEEPAPETLTVVAERVDLSTPDWGADPVTGTVGPRMPTPRELEAS